MLRRLVFLGGRGHGLAYPIQVARLHLLQLLSFLVSGYAGFAVGEADADESRTRMRGLGGFGLWLSG